MPFSPERDAPKKMTTPRRIGSACVKQREPIVRQANGFLRAFRSSGKSALPAADNKGAQGAYLPPKDEAIRAATARLVCSVAVFTDFVASATYRYLPM